MNWKQWWDPTFALEVGCLLVSAPILYFPTRFPMWAIYGSFAILALSWLWRRWQLGIWIRRTPADYTLFILFLVMLPVSLWAAPEPLRDAFSIPKAYVLLWNFCMLWVIVVHASRSWQLLQVAVAGFIAAGMLITTVAPLGMQWLYKYPRIDVILDWIPSPLVGVFRGAEAGFHPNQVAGTLLHILPLLLVLTFTQTRWVRWRPGYITVGHLVTGLMLFCAVVMAGVFFLTQSRAGLAGLVVGVAVMVLINRKWGNFALLVGLVALILILVITPDLMVGLLIDALPNNMLGGTGTFGFRQEVWTAAVIALHDFPFTGLGLGAFRQVARLLYTMNVPAEYEIGHAHNFVLQAGLDLGLPGMVAMLALLMILVWQAIQIFRACRREQVHIDSGNREHLRLCHALSMGFLGGLSALAFQGQLDTVALGAKTNLMFWYLAALILAVGQLLQPAQKTVVYP